MIVRSKAPYRVSFGGGGTDMEPYCVDHGGCVINTSIDRHVYISLEPRDDKKIHVKSIDYEKEMLFEIGDKDYSTDFELFKGIVIDVFLFHLEAEGNKPQIITQVKNNSKKVGIAINPETRVSEVKEYLDKVDFILVMSVHPGWSGQSFIPETLEKVNELAKYKQKFDFLIDVDGGVNLENAKQLKNADILSSSSTILKADSPNRVIQLLKTSPILLHGKFLWKYLTKERKREWISYNLRSNEQNMVQSSLLAFALS
ncbi:MAG: hypothetical protein R6U96_03755 [Promethearchaeia archaeon]